MYLVYFDESGDDGFPTFSSELFILSGLYLHHQQWRENFELIQQFRKQLKSDFGLPSKMELHTRALILDKHPYRDLGIPDGDRREILLRVAQLLPNFSARVINVAINKRKIPPGTNYDVLDRALTYSIQRIENDLSSDPTNKFLVITDEGRHGAMRRTTRRIQVYNPIPSKFGGIYQREIKKLIEDPLPKKSSESYFIQMADFIAFVVYLYAMKRMLGGEWHNRLQGRLSEGDVITILDAIKPILNLRAAPDSPYGIVCYPK
jgi:transposase-like protein